MKKAFIVRPGRLRSNAMSRKPFNCYHLTPVSTRTAKKGRGVGVEINTIMNLWIAVIFFDTKSEVGARSLHRAFFFYFNFHNIKFNIFFIYHSFVCVWIFITMQIKSLRNCTKKNTSPTDAKRRERVGVIREMKCKVERFLPIKAFSIRLHHILPLAPLFFAGEK